MTFIKIQEHVLHSVLAVTLSATAAGCITTPDPVQFEDAPSAPAQPATGGFAMDAPAATGGSPATPEDDGSESGSDEGTEKEVPDDGEVNPPTEEADPEKALEEEEPEPEPGADEILFEMIPSPGIVAAKCLPYAKGEVRVTSKGTVDVMDVALSGLPANTGFDLFLTQVPGAPFGISWYQGDMETDEYGKAEARVIGRFNAEVFAVAPDVAPAPQVHETDAYYNEKVAPIHTFHLGLWFDSPDDAVAAGCPGAVTPFNGEHNAGVQVLNTGNFPDDAGPLSQLN